MEPAIIENIIKDVVYNRNKKINEEIRLVPLDNIRIYGTTFRNLRKYLKNGADINEAGYTMRAWLDWVIMAMIYRKPTEEFEKLYEIGKYLHSKGGIITEHVLFYDAPDPIKDIMINQFNYDWKECYTNNDNFYEFYSSMDRNKINRYLISRGLIDP